MDERLEMIFATGEGARFRITLNDPEGTLTSGEVQAAMDLIVDKDIFNLEGGLAAPVEANIIATEIIPIPII